MPLRYDERIYAPAPSSRRAAMMLLSEIRALIGVEATAGLIARYGGVRLFIPAEIQLSHPLATAIGLEPARALSARYGGEQLDVPDPPAPGGPILELHRRGMSATEIALALSCSVRSVSLVVGGRGDR
jgi:hypothetical protein